MTFKDHFKLWGRCCGLWKKKKGEGESNHVPCKAVGHAQGMFHLSSLSGKDLRCKIAL